MIRHMQKTVLALALVSSSMSALAAFDLRVIGTIAPTACTPTLGGGGTIDYGTIAMSTLSATDYTVLPEKTLSISISCDAPAKVALMGDSGRPGSLAGSSEYSFGQGPAPLNLNDVIFPAVVGLGLHGTEQIGGYGVWLDNVILDGVASVTMSKTTGATTWIDASWGNLFDAYYSRLLSFGVSPATGPVAFEEMVGEIEVQAYINKTSELDLTTPVTLDGLTTIDLVYL